MVGAVDLSFLFDSFVHGRLPYENLKPDPVLRHLLQSLPIRKVVSCSNFTSEISLGRDAEVGTSHRSKGADHALESIHNIKEAVPELWEEGDKTEDVHHPGKIALETSVI
ncbi:hypothetical protein BHE74_00024081 [Ensete ventricosum]|uniref:Uncharacterized protein n=1 Tax=Ensete ventricosum TaxID=4639 RepID=A0A427ARN5_ENSVE|nr:hypothetical protein B296_00024206 [Ensete ventricosum]RWW68395.1 hypothetical protein BHE74_00024081 [Ensete ventricosum]